MITGGNRISENAICNVTKASEASGAVDCTGAHLGYSRLTAVLSAIVL